MGDTLDHTLANPNQLWHYGITVQDNPACDKPLYFMSEDTEFSMALKRQGTIIFADTFTPTSAELHDNPHIVGIYDPVVAQYLGNIAHSAH